MYLKVPGRISIVDDCCSSALTYIRRRHQANSPRFRNLAVKYINVFSLLESKKSHLGPSISGAQARDVDVLVLREVQFLFCLSLVIIQNHSCKDAVSYDISIVIRLKYLAFRRRWLALMRRRVEGTKPARVQSVHPRSRLCTTLPRLPPPRHSPLPILMKCSSVSGGEQD